MKDLRARTVSWSWVGLAGVLIVLEWLFVYEALIADMSGLQKVFGVFSGLAILCFSALLYVLRVVFYD
jgi:hypothetical protein